jgi:secreted trypsin-like serine protease
VALIAACVAAVVIADARRTGAAAPQGGQEGLPGMPSEAQLQRLQRAADDFAREVAGGDPARYLRVFQQAFNLAAESEAAARAGRPLSPAVSLSTGPHGLVTAKAASRSIFDDSVFQKNAQDLIRRRIVGGTKAGPQEFLDCVAVGGEGGFCCTGTLVGPRVVVTAGHCFGECSSQVLVGDDVRKKGQVVRVKKAVRHPDWDPNTLANDLTVLVLEQDVTGVTPRPIADGSQIDAATALLLVGFGNTDPQSTRGFGVKRKVFAPIATTSCGDPAAQGRFGCNADKEVVAGAPFLNRDSCNGDSGGPAYVLDAQGRAFVAAATSRATSEASRPCGDGGIYVRLDRYKDWIRATAETNGASLGNGP